jgi:phosphate starvation-inducible PhoH-like protein
MTFPRGLAQGKYLSLLQSAAPIIIGTGPAGTGKTFLACQAGAKALIKGQVERLVLTRPAVSVDEQHGFLPGTLEKKMDPWTRPMFDCLRKHIDPKKLQNYVEICPLAYMRGRTFENAWIIGDEMQNSTPAQMKMLLTRIGDGSKLVVTGDVQQYDRGFENNGLSDLIGRVYPSSEFIQHVQFTEEDVVRHPAIQEILSMYDK